MGWITTASMRLSNSIVPVLGIQFLLLSSLINFNHNVSCAPSLKLFGIQRTQGKDHVPPANGHLQASKYLIGSNSNASSNHSNGNSGESQEYTRHLRKVLQEDKVNFGKDWHVMSNNAGENLHYKKCVHMYVHKLKRASVGHG